MAVIRKKKSEGTPGISTASLPDVIFMLLFFFMVSTTMRQQEVMVQTKLPVASESQKLENKSLASYIYVGPPTKSLQGKYGDATRIQLNDSFRQVWEVGNFIAGERDKRSERDRANMRTVLKIHENTFMGIVTDIKQALRRAGALKIIYAAQKVMSEDGNN